MDNQYGFVCKEELWRLQSDLKSIYAVQSEHADRLLRLERRYDDDTRSKSVWGTASFPSIRGGTPHQDPQYNPAAEAFKNFDQDNSTNLLGSLHLDADEEPRRGASRANSVRFDESALHGQLSHTSRSSSEFFPLRTGSAIGSHPLTERSSSHKSEGRQSSAGLSTHSAALNGLGYEQQGQASLADLPVRPAPGMLLLGPHPSIIRCWLSSRFSNETLRYAAVNTGASQSAIARSWLNELGLQDRIYREGDMFKAKLQISFPEATMQQSTLGSASPSTRLPSLSATLIVFDSMADDGAIQCFLGSDILRTRNADILFSQDRLVLWDDDHNKLNIPLVRPEHASTYDQLATTNLPPNMDWRSMVGQHHENRSVTEAVDGVSSANLSHRSKPSYARLDWSRVRQGKSGSPIGSGQASPRLRDSDSDPGILKREQNRALLGKASEPEAAINSPQPDTSASADQSEMWTSWRKDSTGRDQRKEPTFSSVASSTGQRNTSQSRGMKILKTRRMSSNRTASNAESPHPEPSPSMWGAAHNGVGGNSGDGPGTRRSYSSDLKSAFSGGNNGTRPTNPVGGASAFGWLNPAQAR